MKTHMGEYNRGVSMLRKVIKQIFSAHGKALKKIKKIIKKIYIFINRRYERMLIWLHCYKTVELSVDDMLLKQTRYGELLRCDIIVRLLAIENYYGKNDFGFKLYAKMQDARMGKGYSEKSIIEFKKLISSYERYGYDKESKIILDKNFNLIDGSHRISMALYHHIPYIMANIVNSKHDVEYTIDWFLMNGFTTEEIYKIINKYKSVNKKVNNRFFCIIWSPAYDYAEEIIKDISVYGIVGNIKKYNYSTGEYDNIVRAVYAIDDIEKWKIEKKVEHMRNYKPKLTVLELSFQNPEYRLKTSTGLLISKNAERVKKAIRTKYKEKISDYYFDIILHIGDNIYQSNYMRKVFDSDFDFREIVEILNHYKYAFVKISVPYIPVEFPDKIPVGKDADILCSKNDWEEIKKQISKALEKYCYYNILLIDQDDGFKIRIQQGKTLFYLIDVSYKILGAKGSFLEDALTERVYDKRGFYTLRNDYEYVYRAFELHKNPQKIYHKRYLIENRNDYDVALFDQYFDFDLVREIGIKLKNNI